MPEISNQQKDTQATEGAAGAAEEQQQQSQVESETLEATAEESTDWGTFDEGFDDSSTEGDAPTERQVETQEQEVVEEAPEQTPAPEATAADTTQQQAAPETTQEETQEQRTAPDLEVDVDTQWNQREQALAQFHQIDEETANAILDNPQEHLPKLLARVQATAERTIWENLHQVLPDTVQHVLETQRGEQEVQDAFFGAWPQLKAHVDSNPGAAQVIQNLRNTFESQPGAEKLSQEDKIHQVGAAAMVALGIPFEQQQQQQRQNRPAGAQPVPQQTQSKTRQSAGKNASSPGGKQLGAFEEFDAELGGDGISSRGATVY